MNQPWTLSEIMQAAQQSSEFASDLWRKMLYGQYTLEISGGPNNIPARSCQSHDFENTLRAAVEPLAAGYSVQLSGPNGLDLNADQIKQHLQNSTKM